MRAEPLAKSTAYENAMRLQCSLSIAAQCCLGIYVEVYVRPATDSSTRAVCGTLNVLSLERVEENPKAYKLTHVGLAGCVHDHRQISTNGSAMRYRSYQTVSILPYHSAYDPVLLFTETMVSMCVLPFPRFLDETHPVPGKKQITYRPSSFSLRLSLSVRPRQGVRAC